MKRFLAMLLCMTAAAGRRGALAEGEFPELNEAGFFDGGEFVYTDAENGCVALLQRYAEGGNLPPHLRSDPKAHLV